MRTTLSEHPIAFYFRYNNQNKNTSFGHYGVAIDVLVTRGQGPDPEKAITQWRVSYLDQDKITLEGDSYITSDMIAAWQLFKDRMTVLVNDTNQI